MKKKNCRNLVLTIILFSTACILAGTKPISQNPASKLPSEKSDSFKNDLLLNPLTSAWIPNGTAVCTESNTQEIYDSCSDGEGGAIIVWADNRTAKKISMGGGGFYIDSNLSVYAQRINSTGDIQWDPNGVAICTITNNWIMSIDPVICSDGDEGAIIAWVDNRSGNQDIYAQRINSTGDTRWDDNGIAICSDISTQFQPRIISDMGDGAIIVWHDSRNEHSNIYGSGVEDDGTIRWEKPICNYIGDLKVIGDICTDGYGGAIIAWTEPNRVGGFDVSIYSQRIDYFGNTPLGWKPNGTAICTITNYILYTYCKVCDDGMGGAIIAWIDNRTGGIDIYANIYAQRIDSNGITLWIDNGTAICTDRFDQTVRDICNNGENGAIVVWDDERTVYASDKDIYAQEIDSDGISQWTPNGTAICIEEEEQHAARIVSDGMGGALIIWPDKRNGLDHEDDIYAQHIDSEGNAEWTTNGKVICNSNNRQSKPCVIYETGSAIIAWEDTRSGNSDIYAQKMEIGEFEEEEIYNIYIQIKEQVFSEEQFNITFYVFNASDYDWGISEAEIEIWWNEVNVTDDLMDKGFGNYSISLEAITVQPGETPIKLNGTLNAIGFIPQDFEFYIAVDPELIDKTVSPPLSPANGDDDNAQKEEGSELPIVTLLVISIGSAIGIVGVVLVLIKKGIIFKNER